MERDNSSQAMTHPYVLDLRLRGESTSLSNSPILSTVTIPMRLVLAPYVITLLCMLLRSLQLVLALVAMITAAMSFPLSTEINNQVFSLGSAETTFTLLVSYTIIEYSGAFLVLVELFPMMLRPSAIFTRISDSLLVVLALISGIVLATSDYVQDCEDYDTLVHCTNLTASSVFIILCAMPIFGSLLLTFVTSEDVRLSDVECRDRAGSYRMVATPKSPTLSPVDTPGFVTV